MLIHLWGYRKATASRGTINLIKIGTIKEDEVNHFLFNVEKMESDNTFNFNEVPIFFYNPPDKTVDKIGEKSIKIQTNNNDKKKLHLFFMLVLVIFKI